MTVSQSQPDTAPVAYRVKDYADGWILCHTYEVAWHESNEGDCLIQPLYLSRSSTVTDDLVGEIAALPCVIDCRTGAKETPRDTIIQMAREIRQRRVHQSSTGSGE